MDNLYNFKNPEHLVRMSPFLVASYIGKSDALHLEAEKLVDLFDFEELSSAVSLRSENYQFTARLIFVLYLLAAFGIAGTTESFGFGFLMFLVGLLNYIIISWLGLVLGEIGS